MDLDVHLVREQDDDRVGLDPKLTDWVYLPEEVVILFVGDSPDSQFKKTSTEEVHNKLEVSLG